MRRRCISLAALASAVLLAAVRVEALDSWVAVGPFGSAVKVVAVDPYTPTTLYAGTPQGVYRSPDGGTTWSATGLVDVDINAIAFDPASSTTLYAATSAGMVLRTTDLALSWEPSTNGLPPDDSINALVVAPGGALYVGTRAHGVYTATAWGNDWSALPTGMTDTHVRSLVLDPTTPTTLYAGTTTGGVFRTTDGGGTWTAVNTGLGGFKVAALDLRPGVALLAGTNVGVFKSTDGGDTWTASPQSINVRAIARDPQNALIVYAGADGGGMFASGDAGTNFAAINTGLGNRLVRDVAVNPTNPAVLYAGTAGGGVSISNDFGAHWNAANDGLPGLGVTGLALDPRTPWTLYAAVKGAGVFVTIDGGTTWTQAIRGLGFFDMTALALDPLGPDTLYAGTTAGLYRTADDAALWTAINGSGDTNLPDLHVVSLAVDPMTVGTLYAGTADGGAFKSINKGNDWTVTALTGTSIQCMTIEPTGSSTLFAGTPFGVERTDDGGETWADTSLEADVRALALDPGSGVVYAGTAAGVFAMTDTASWDSRGLDSSVVASIAFDPAHIGTLYAGTNGGVFASTNDGGSWTPANGGFPVGTLPDVTALAIDQTGTVVYAGSAESGVFRSGTPPTTTTTTLSSVTTTTSGTPLASPCALGCDDGDPCTTDTCASGACRHDPLQGFEAASCVLVTPALPFDVCGGAIPSSVARRIDRARTLIENTAQMVPRRAKASLARAWRMLRAARRLTLAAGKRGTLPAACTDALARLLAKAAARTRALYH